MSAQWLLMLAGLSVFLWPRRSETLGATWARSVTGRATSPTARSLSQGLAGPADVADSLALFSLALKAGIGQHEALERVAECSAGTVRASLRSVAAALRWGRAADEAWSYAPPEWRAAALAWRVAETTGAPAAELIADASRRLREEEARCTEAAISRAGVLLVLPLGLAFLPAFACTSVVPVVLALTHSVLGS